MRPDKAGMVEKGFSRQLVITQLASEASPSAL
jgi:hypothetical protein